MTSQEKPSILTAMKDGAKNSRRFDAQKMNQSFSERMSFIPRGLSKMNIYSTLALISLGSAAGLGFATSNISNQAEEDHRIATEQLQSLQNEIGTYSHRALVLGTSEEAVDKMNAADELGASMVRWQNDFLGVERGDYGSLAQLSDQGRDFFTDEALQSGGTMLANREWFNYAVGDANLHWENTKPVMGTNSNITILWVLRDEQGAAYQWVRGVYEPAEGKFSHLSGSSTMVGDDLLNQQSQDVATDHVDTGEAEEENS